MYESPVLPIRIKAPWKNHQYFFQSYFPYTLFTSKSRNNRRHKSRSLALLCLMFLASFFILCHYYQSISLDSTAPPLNDVMEVTTTPDSTSLFNPPASSLGSQKSSFLLSSLLWPSQMFSSDMSSSSSSFSSSSSSWSPPAQLVTASTYEMERTQLTHLEPASVSISSSSFPSSSLTSAISSSSSSLLSSSSSSLPSLVASGPTEKRLPQVIIIGVRKCGTRALLEFLNLHSKIQKARDEVHFFDEDSKYEQGLEWYRSQMPYSYSDQVTIEKTPAYFVTDSAPERIRAMNSSIRLILLVRDPVTRLISDYAQLNANKLAKKERPLRSIEHMVLLSDGSVNVNYRPVKTSIYSYYYAKWAEVSEFGRKNLFHSSFLLLFHTLMVKAFVLFYFVLSFPFRSFLPHKFMSSTVTI